MGPEAKYQAVWLTGATGFVGSHVPARLLAGGRRAVCPVRRAGGTRLAGSAGVAASTKRGPRDRDETVGRSYDLVGPAAVTWNEMYRTAARVLVGREKMIFHFPVWLAKFMARVFRLLPSGGPGGGGRGGLRNQAGRVRADASRVSGGITERLAATRRGARGRWSQLPVSMLRDYL